MEREWKLGEDVFEEDNILDGITFKELIDTLHANYGSNVTLDKVKKTLRDIELMHLEDMWNLYDINKDEIKKRANGTEV